jgi:hypothetical protein
MLNYFRRRKETKEIERRIKFKRGKSQVESYINKLAANEKKLFNLGKRSHKLGDKAQFVHIAKAILWTQEQRNRWERYLVQMETMEARRDQVQATGAFVGSMKAMTESMMQGASVKDITKAQVEMENALARAESVEETMNVVMEASADSAFSSDELTDEKINELQRIIAGDASVEEEDVFDSKISDGLKSIEEELKRD